jgi:hypothetical protein
MTANTVGVIERTAPGRAGRQGGFCARLHVVRAASIVTWRHRAAAGVAGKRPSPADKLSGAATTCVNRYGPPPGFQAVGHQINDAAIWTPSPRKWVPVCFADLRKGTGQPLVGPGRVLRREVQLATAITHAGRPSGSAVARWLRLTSTRVASSALVRRTVDLIGMLGGWTPTASDFTQGHQAGITRPELGSFHSGGLTSGYFALAV